MSPNPTARGERCVLLDRDGVLNEHIRGGYVTEPGMLRLIPGAAEGVALFNRAGYKVVVLSNQQCVGKGIVSPVQLEGISERLREMLHAESGGVIEAFLYCTHLAEEDCTCRKPKPGLVLQARARFGFDLERTFFIGDAYSDLATAANAGCRAGFVLTGADADRCRRGDPFPHDPAFVAAGLPQAARCVIDAED